ncbi:MAG: DUF998 domain-containing protein [Actinomycetota bacterium]|nr:DUF998 domain-containing protein [Actinomycetota bacterium]
MTRWRALGGVVGPAAFIGAWSILGTTVDGYSPVDDPISRLAALGADTRPGMTAGLLVFAAGVTGLAAELRRSPAMGDAWIPALITAGGAVGIALTPLDSSLGGAAHGTAAGVSYASLALVPLLASRALRATGRRRLAGASLAAGLVCAGSLAASVLVDDRTGLWQRLGLTTGDVWLMASAVALTLRPNTD